MLCVVPANARDQCAQTKQTLARTTANVITARISKTRLPVRNTRVELYVREPVSARLFALCYALCERCERIVVCQTGTVAHAVWEKRTHRARVIYLSVRCARATLLLGLVKCYKCFRVRATK